MAKKPMSNDLIMAMNNPSLTLYSDEFIVILADKYPKSCYHYLVLPREDISEVSCLNTSHIPMLLYMELKGLEYVMLTTGLPIQSFKTGYHAYPSMNRLHLHVLSIDFRSNHLMYPFQWNSFHTEFFLPTNKLISELHTMGCVELPPKKCLYQPTLRCHMCNYFCSNVQNIKLHLNLFHYQLPNVCETFDIYNF